MQSDRARQHHKHEGRKQERESELKLSTFLTELVIKRRCQLLTNSGQQMRGSLQTWHTYQSTKIHTHAWNHSNILMHTHSQNHTDMYKGPHTYLAPQTHMFNTRTSTHSSLVIMQPFYPFSMPSSIEQLCQCCPHRPVLLAYRYNHSSALYSVYKWHHCIVVLAYG